MTDSRGGQEVGQEYVDKLRRYLDTVTTLPARSGKLNVTAIAEASGVPRQSLYKNDNCRQMLEEATAAKGLMGIADTEERKADDASTVKLERRITSLEQANSALVAENYELRRQLKKLRHIEEMMEQGHRVIA